MGMQKKMRERCQFPHREGKPGFTLIELIITMALITIVAMIAVPSFRSIAVNGNLKAAAADMASDFALYRQRALAENTMYQITITDGQNYSIEQCTNLGSACGGWGGVQNKNLADIAGDIAFTTGEAVYTFQPRGIITAGTNTIGLTNSRGSTATMNITAAGRTRVTFALH
jgi:prepilin-type N-terminal cleavage/methylation domain-containing protein